LGLLSLKEIEKIKDLIMPQVQLMMILAKMDNNGKEPNEESTYHLDK
jgi:hypothetical protein